MKRAPTSPALLFRKELPFAFAPLQLSPSIRYKSTLWSVAVLAFFGVWGGTWYAYDHRSAPSTTLSTTNAVSHTSKTLAPTTLESPLGGGTSQLTPVAQTQTTTSTEGLSNGRNSSVHVTVNGQPIAVPQNGSTQKVLSDVNGQTTVNVSSSSSSSTTSEAGSTTTSLEVYTQTTSDNSSAP